MRLLLEDETMLLLKLLSSIPETLQFAPPKLIAILVTSDFSTEGKPEFSYSGLNSTEISALS